MHTFVEDFILKRAWVPTGIHGCSRDLEPMAEARDDGSMNEKSISYHVWRVLAVSPPIALSCSAAVSLDIMIFGMWGQAESVRAQDFIVNYAEK